MPEAKIDSAVPGYWFLGVADPSFNNPVVETTTRWRGRDLSPAALAIIANIAETSGKSQKEVEGELLAGKTIRW